jgi:alkylation response protein AidB-like acyl-CoA dehydrogenase
MDILENKETQLFREEVRTWLAENTPREKRPLDGQMQRAFDVAWQKRQWDGGWAGIAWPTEFGGRGLSLIQLAIWYEEYSRAGAPPSGAMFVGLSHAGPTLTVKGTTEQKAFHLPKILRGEAVWCQGFSEPGAGSDLASLRTRAEIDGDHLVINGSKIWTTYGNLADYQELLVRTDPAAPKHRGISWVICDMKAPGIDIRPIRAMSGLTHFCQVFYDNVRIPLSNVVGDVNAGWATAMTTLGFERGTALIAHQIELSRTVERLVEVARTVPAADGRRKAIEDDAIAAELAGLSAEVAALRSMSALNISRAMHSDVPGPEGNLAALHFGELIRRLYAFGFKLMGPAALEQEGPAGDWPLEYLEGFKWAIGGGTSEIRRNTIGERVLGLPKQGRAS